MPRAAKTRKYDFINDEIPRTTHNDCVVEIYNIPGLHYWVFIFKSYS
jgi:hypothetical protein